jgi:HAD superfamily hydrolase (TIGR01549 family)
MATTPSGTVASTRVVHMAGSSLERVRAVLLDVDGTLYRQSPVRLQMALEIAIASCIGGSLSRARAVSRTIREFRRVHEDLRVLGSPTCSLAVMQIRETARRVGVTPDLVEHTIADWMSTRPLKYLPRSKRPGVETFLEAAARAGLLVGALSDYPAAEKIAALGLSRYFSLTLCTTDPPINALKPHACGFLYACRLWGLTPQEVLYVGDRPEVDAIGACAAGMPCAIVGQLGRGRRRGKRTGQYLAVRGFADLGAALAVA